MSYVWICPVGLLAGLLALCIWLIASPRIIKYGHSLYFVINLPFHKSLETGIQIDHQPCGFRFDFNVRTRGDHAGLRSYIGIHSWFAEFNITDNRHWNHQANRWCNQDEYETDEEA